jgi:hypothetical protein
VSIDDAERDAKLKDAMRWGDPMAGMVFRKTEHHKSSKKSKKDAPSGPQLEYQGKVQYPNRFNIKPGVAWDGEKKNCSCFSTFLIFAFFKVEIDQMALKRDILRTRTLPRLLLIVSSRGR